MWIFGKNGRSHGHPGYPDRWPAEPDREISLEKWIDWKWKTPFSAPGNSNPPGDVAREVGRRIDAIERKLRKVRKFQKLQKQSRDA